MADNYAKVKSRKFASDDDAENLLAGILDETEDIARAEQERIEAEIQARESLEIQRREDKERRRKEEAAAKLNAELERLEKVEQRRTAKLEALKIEDLKARGEWIDPEEERRKLEEKVRKEAEEQAMREAATAEARRKTTGSNAAVDLRADAPTPDKSRAGLMIGVGVAIALLLSVSAAGFVVMTGYELDSAAYSKAVFAPKDVEVAMVEKGTTLIPKPEPVVVEVEKDSKPATKRRAPQRARAAAKKPQSKRPAQKISSPPKQNTANKKAKALEDALNTDIFGSGF